MKNKTATLSVLLLVAFACSIGCNEKSYAASRPIDPKTGCPKDGKYSEVSAILLDTTDSLSPVQQEAVQKKLDEFAENVPRYGELEVFVVRPSSDRLIEPLLQVCNPGRASDTNVFTGNPRLMEKRWRDKFKDPLDRTLNATLSNGVSSKQSPIMEEIQQVSVQAFFETPPKTSKRFAIVSDMLQNSPVLNQYHDSGSFEQFRNTPGFVKVRPELKDVEITVLYVRRSSDLQRQGKRHVEFWQGFFDAAGAEVKEVKSVNG